MRGFGPILWTGGAAAAVLACYLVSLQVASERAALENTERQILKVTAEIRELETEIGTRGRLAQLEKWNAGFLNLKAPASGQFLEGSFQLATLMKPKTVPVLEAPVILASAEVEEGQNLSDMVVTASLESAPAEKVNADPLAPLPQDKEASNTASEGARAPQAFTTSKEPKAAR
ncbi:hypothetical protein [Sphingomicrobium flavum]|uniref:hypothetical protein n=1 Tax=Sphingomicrobium flavum TaxID=1229164 RepID=UPI0021AE2588|nr:hypothetical protein [Sphingomicrobium flavum]